MNNPANQQGTELPPHLTSDEHGTVFWRGVAVESISCTDPSNLNHELTDIARRCQLLEDKGFPVSDHTVAYPHCYDAEAGTPWKRALCHLHTVYQRPDGQGAAVFERHNVRVGGPQFFLAYRENGELTVQSAWSRWDISEARDERVFSSLGDSIARDETMNLLQATGLSVEDVDSILDSAA
jgi:hypothetical protein